MMPFGPIASISGAIGFGRAGGAVLPPIVHLESVQFQYRCQKYRRKNALPKRSSPAGINVKSVLNSAALVKKKFDKGTRGAQVQKAVNHLMEALEMQKELKTCGQKRERGGEFNYFGCRTNFKIKSFE